ncbi:hypothetical protein [Desulfocurvibacter africanus]|uniref:hypothetical protein n=1 Tax=Desulfocurvibacter africanus TaxID=873 RepID=UPI0004200FB7|nr:hypothetical protein [Desulfocurvibacter africanus]
MDGQGQEKWCDVSAAPMLFEGRSALVCSAMDLTGRADAPASRADKSLSRS